MGNVAIIGGGPAGMMAAEFATRAMHNVVIFEHNEKLGKKLYITGKGRCNVTNIADRETFFDNVGRNPRFLYSALANFSSEDIMQLIEQQKVPLKVERGGRVFPISDKSSDILGAFTRIISKSGAAISLKTHVSAITTHPDGGFIIDADGAHHKFDFVVLATGGKSYPSTGSDGSGYGLARALGHTIIEPRPSLVPLETVETWPGDVMGLTLKNVMLRVMYKNKRMLNEVGELLFTHFGVSGPLVLTASSIIADNPESATLEIDLKPGLTHEELDRRIIRDFESNNRKQLSNAILGLMPSSLVPIIVRLSGINPDKQVCDISKKERQALGSLLKCLTLRIARSRPLDEAVITRGGVSVKEISPATMESRLVKGLYFAGEIIDIDAYTGGFNLQLAYSTGALAGGSIPY